MSKTLFALAITCLMLAGCATSQRVTQPGGQAEYRITCGYFGWYLCYDNARTLCPDGYKVVSESEGYGPKELRITCSRAT